MPLQGFFVSGLNAGRRASGAAKREYNVNDDNHQPAPSLTEQQQRRPLAELLLLAAPTIARVADLEAAVAGPAEITCLAVIGFGFGVVLVVNTLVSHAFGRQDDAAAGQYLWQGVWFPLAFGAVTLLLFPYAQMLFAAM